MSDLGAAKGRVVINTDDFKRAQKEAERASQQITNALKGIGAAVGIAYGYQAITQIGRFALEADKVATAYARQSVAARSLAGSQSALNELLSIYDRATGGAIDKATALADVTRLQAVGFADTTAELEKFVTAARGISIATGQSQDYVISQLQLAIANQSTLRLDQLGLGVSEVKQRIDELKAANKGLTDEMAYQQAILGLADKKFGALTRSAEAQATGIEKLDKAWKDFQLSIGQGASGGTNMVFSQWASDIERATREMQQFSDFLVQVERAGAGFRRSLGFNESTSSLTSSEQSFIGSSTSRDRGRHGGGGAEAGGGALGARFTPEQLSVAQNWAEGVAQIEQDANQQRLDATRQYEESRTSTIREYGKTLARDAEDFARGRLRAEQQLAQSIADIHENAARREADQAEELTRRISDARDDSGKKTAEIREDAGERLLEIEEDYQLSRERAEADHRDKLLSAAGRLDAVAILEERKRFLRQSKDAKDAHDEQRDDLNEQLQERLEDEAEALGKAIRQAQEAHARQLEDAREDDATRILDMLEDFAERKRLEDEDRAIRLARMAVDHADQLAQMDIAHAANIARIIAQEAKELAEHTKAADARFLAEGGHNAKLEAEQLRHHLAAEAAYAAHLDALTAIATGTTQGPAPQNPFVTPGQFPSLLGGGAAPSGYRSSGSIAPSGSRTVNIAPGAIIINGDGLNERQVAELIIDYMEAA